MVLIYRGDALGMDGLREILGMIAQQLDQRMLLARWHNGERTSYMIIQEAAAPCHPALEPIVLAMPDGACVSVGAYGMTGTVGMSASASMVPTFNDGCVERTMDSLDNKRRVLQGNHGCSCSIMYLALEMGDG
jgi:hypothetical protein